MEENTIIEKLEFIRDEKVNKIIPENIKSGVNILNVEGTYEGSSSGGVKLFDTVAEMQADQDAQEGDLAVVYHNGSRNWDGVQSQRYISFPETVKLPQAVVSSTRAYFMASTETMWGQGDAYLSSSQFTFNYFLDGETQTVDYYVKYTSSDGINYTRTNFPSGQVNPLDMKCNLAFEDMEGEGFNPNIRILYDIR